MPDLPNWKTVVPRLGLSYDLLGKGKTVLQASASKYEGVQSVAFAQSVDPMFLTSETCTWVPPPGTTPAMMPTNGVAIVAASTFTKCTRFNGSVGTHLGPTVKCPYSWECTVQQEIMPQFVVSVGYYHRQNRNNLGIANSLVPSSDYTPYTITNRSMDLL